MAFPRRLATAAAAAMAFLVQDAALAAKTTVCTITVNSADERETFRRNLPSGQYEFVELVERGRPDWLASACRMGVRCDVLVISGHFDGGDEFYSDRVDARESLPVAEMERVSCGADCAGLFSQLKEVYLFGCNTLNPDALHAAPAEIAQSLVAAGHPEADARELSQMLAARYGDSNRDRMRAIFPDVPAIYGFSSKAPLGAKAGPLLERYFQGGGAPAIGSGEPSAKLLSLFAPSSMTVTSGVGKAEPQAAYRADLCRFVDDRVSKAQRLAFVHSLFSRDMAEVRLFLDRIEHALAALGDADRASAPVAAALAGLASDVDASRRYVAYLRNVHDGDVRTRLIEVAARIDWFSPTERIAELTRMLADRVRAADVGAADVDLACRLNREHALDAARTAMPTAAAKGDDVARAGIVACLGGAEARAEVVAALTAASERDAPIAQAYLRHHPIVDAAELRGVAGRIAQMRDADAQVRALDALAGNRVVDVESLESLARLFPVAKSVGVQRAIAGVLIRSDYEAIARPELVRALREKRLKSPDGQDLIDVLIRRMQAALSKVAQGRDTDQPRRLA